MSKSFEGREGRGVAVRERRECGGEDVVKRRGVRE
jgi:hypothetical protein